MKLVCIGDSLTYGYGTFRKDCWVELLKKELNIEIVNKGINGDTTAGMLVRFYDDVIQYSPSHVIIMGGTNDFISNRSLISTQNNMKALIDDAIQNNIIPIIGIEPLVDKILAERKWTDAVDYDQINLMLKEYRKWIINFSEELHIDYIDFHSCFLLELKDKDPRELYVDGLHPTSYGHTLMSKCVLNIFKKYRG